MDERIGIRSTGMELRIRRVALGVKQRELAARLAVSPQRVANVEGMYRPPRTIVRRYLDALAEAAGDELLHAVGAALIGARAVRS